MWTIVLVIVGVCLLFLLVMGLNPPRRPWTGDKRAAGLDCPPPDKRAARSWERVYEWLNGR